MEVKLIQQKIHEVRGCKVMFDFDLAEMYGVETKVFNQTVKRNLDRFPTDFMFQLTQKERITLNWSQFVTSSGKHRGHSYLPSVFTEHGITMLASVLRSDRAIKMNIAIVRAFIALREMAMHYKELAAQIKELEERYDRQFADIYEVLKVLMEDKQTRDNLEDRERIGFKQY